MKWKKKGGKSLISVPVLMLFFVLSENSQQKVWEEQEKHPDNPKQHLRRRGTTQLGERGWVNNQCHSRLLWEIHDLIKKICLPPRVCRDHFSELRWEKKSNKTLSEMINILEKGRVFRKLYFPWEETSGNLKWCSQKWSQATEAMMSSLPMKHCAWFP